MCFQFGAWRKGSQNQSKLLTTTPQTLLTSTAPGKVKGVRFDSEIPETVLQHGSPTRRPARKGTPWHGGGNGDAMQTVQLTGDIGEKDDEDNPVRKEVRKATPWHRSLDADAATESHIRFAANSCTDQDGTLSGREAECTEETEPSRREVKTPKVDKWPTAAQVIDNDDKSSRHIHWSVSAEQAFQVSLSNEAVNTDSMRRPGRKGTPFTISAKATESSAENDRHVQWPESVQAPSARRPDRKGTPWHSGAQNGNCEDAEKKLRWLESAEEADENGNGQESRRADLEQDSLLHAAAEELVLEDGDESTESNDKAETRGLSLLTACCMCWSSPSVSTSELRMPLHAT